MAKFLGVKIDTNEEKDLELLVAKSGRSQSNVVQRLITFAVTNQEALKALGIVDNNRMRFEGGIRP